MSKETLAERITAIESRCPLREQLMDEKLQGIYKQLNAVNVSLDKIDHTLNNGLKQLVMDHSEEIKSHKLLMEKLMNRDGGERTRTTDLSNRKPIVKYSIIVTVIGLVLGNLVTIGIALVKLGEILSSWGGMK